MLDREMETAFAYHLDFGQAFAIEAIEYCIQLHGDMVDEWVCRRAPR